MHVTEVVWWAYLLFALAVIAFMAVFAWKVTQKGG